jgi:diadenosine tetraphosphate (Ap4A) HIT family hydrolase
MVLIYETKNFTVETAEKPHVDRDEGGHIRIVPKEHFLDRTKLSPKLAIEFMRLSMAAGEAMKTALTKRGLEIMRINYQEMGNWAYKTGEKPYLHLHIYGRAKNAKKQLYKEAVYLPDRSTGFYDSFKPLKEEDAKAIRKEIERIFEEEKYNDSNWKL